MLRICAFDVPPDPQVRALGRRLPALLHERLLTVPGIEARLDLEGALRRAEVDALLEGAVSVEQARRSAGADLGWTVQLRRRDGSPLLTRGERFRASAVFRRLDRLAIDVAAALGLEPPQRLHLRGPRTFPAVRDYLRATDLDDGVCRLDLEDRRLALEWLLLSVEADPAFRPARDALLESVLRAHEAGLEREALKTLWLAARLAPRDARVPFVLGELALLDGRPDEAMAAFRRCLRLEPAHGEANFKLGLLLDGEGDRAAAKRHFLVAGRRGRVEALLLRGILCAEDGERRKARAAWARAATLDPTGQIGAQAREALDRSAASPPRRARRRR